MAIETIDWEELEYLNPGPVPGRWSGRLTGQTANQHARVFVDVEPERDPAPEYYEATFQAEFPEPRLPAFMAYSHELALEGRDGAQGYILRGATKEERIDVTPFKPE